MRKMNARKPSLARRFRRWGAVAVLALAPLLAPATSMARTEEPEPDMYDARLEGYPGSVTLPLSSTGLTWFLFIILAVVAAGGLFKDAKRSHLD